jgi:glycosyltransferase involved in cell wall biosynthesis
MPADMMPPRVTVILPCYNAHRYLDEAIASVRAQTLPEVEIVVVDDGSTDPATLAHLAALPADVRVVRQENRGLAGARNSGFREARGEFVLPLDCDDRLAPTMLEACLAALERGGGYAHAHMTLFGDESGVVRKTFNFFEQLATNQLPYCLLVPRALWLEAGGYDESMRLGYEDWEFNIRLGALGHFGAQVSEPLFHYRVSAAGMLKSVSQRRHAAIWSYIQSRHPLVYSWRGLLRHWRHWRGRPSTHPLAIVWVLVALHRVLPEAAFNRLFRRLHGIGKSTRY